ncbi:hypothetical protein Q7P37_009667 [Cladosporium fusiforme]
MLQSNGVKYQRPPLGIVFGSSRTCSHPSEDEEPHKVAPRLPGVQGEKGQETLPTCAHCARLGMECAYPPLLPTPPKGKLQSSDTLTLTKPRLPHVLEPLQGRSLSDYIMPTTPETSSELAVLESLNYFNTRLTPEVAPAHPPFQRTLIGTAQWLAAPKVIQLSLVVLTKSCQKSRSTQTPSLDKDLCQVKADCLNELKPLIGNVANERYALAFDCIQLMMLAEMQIEPTGSWSYHLEATRRLIAMQGGVGGLFYQTPALQGMLINYMEIDIITSTTCPVNLLDPDAVSSQSAYITLLAHREKETITTPCFSPISLLQAIVDINNLRVRLSQPNDNNDSMTSLPTEHTRIAHAISSFNPTSWATKILSYASPHPSAPPNQANNSAMTALAHCHQDASLLYLHLSCPSTSTQPQILPTLSSNLTKHLATLLAQASTDTEADIHTQLFKFAVWPMFVAAYACIGWGLSGDGGGERSITRLRQVARAIESRPLRLAADLLESVWERRYLGRGSGAGGDTVCLWDDAFGEGRGSFCVL